MKPKEKAIELVEKFKKYAYSNTSHDSDLFYRILQENAKQCALVAVDEILTARPLMPNNVDWDGCGVTHKYWYEEQKQEALNYWQEVKEEIEKL